MSEILFVLIDQYADWEAASIAAALNSGGHMEKSPYTVKTLAISKEPVKSIGGFLTLPDYGLSSVPQDFNALLLIGAKTWQAEAPKQLLPLIRHAVERQVPVGAICGASVFLGMHGFLNHVRHTSNTLSDLKEAAGKNYTGEALYLEQQAVSDGNIITANGSAFLEFGREVLKSLNTFPQPEIDGWYDFFKLGYHEYMKRNTQGNS